MPTVETPGARLSFSDAGSGPAVLFIQGIGLVGEGWRPQVEGLAARFRLLTFDNRGIGGSERLSAAPLSIEVMAADAWAVADAAGAAGDPPAINALLAAHFDAAEGRS